MNDLLKRKKEIEEEFDEIIEMDSDLVNVKSNITISVIGKLLQKFNEYLMDMAEIASKNKYYDEGLGKSIQSTISELKTAFSQIQPPTVNVTPNINFDVKPLQPVLSEISKQNETIISLVNKFNTNESNELQKLIVAMVEKNNAFIDKGFEVINYSKELKYIGEGVNKKATEWEATVTQWNNQGRLEKLRIKTIK